MDWAICGFWKYLMLLLVISENWKLYQMITTVVTTIHTCSKVHVVIHETSIDERAELYVDCRILRKTKNVWMIITVVQTIQWCWKVHVVIHETSIDERAELYVDFPDIQRAICGFCLLLIAYGMMVIYIMKFIYNLIISLSLLHSNTKPKQQYEQKRKWKHQKKDHYKFRDWAIVVKCCKKGLCSWSW